MEDVPIPEAEALAGQAAVLGLLIVEQGPASNQRQPVILSLPSAPLRNICTLLPCQSEDAREAGVKYSVTGITGETHGLAGWS